jgi:hypothetical protein
MKFIDKEKLVTLNGLTIKCEPERKEELQKDLQFILSNIAVNDIKGLRRLVEQPAKLQMARSFM